MAMAALWYRRNRGMITLLDEWRFIGSRGCNKVGRNIMDIACKREIDWKLLVYELLIALFAVLRFRNRLNLMHLRSRINLMDYSSRELSIDPR